MKVNVKAADLKPVVKVLAGINPRRLIAKSPILECIKITAHRDRIVLTATDLDMHVSFTLEGTTEEEGAALVRAKQLLSICEPAAPENEIVIKSTEQSVAVSICGAQRIDCSDYPIPVEDFPPEKEVDAPLLERMPDDLRTLWASVIWTMSKDKTRYFLNGIFFHRNAEEKLCAVATDGHCLAFRSMEIPERTLHRCFKKAVTSNDTDNRGFIVPAAMARLVLKFLPKKGTNTPVQIKMDGTRIDLEAGAFRINGKLIDGRFPDYERIIPKKLLSEAKLRAELPAESISGVMQSIKKLSDKKAYPTVRFDFSATSVDITAEFSTKGERIHRRLPIHNGGEDMTIYFNAGYVLDILASLGSEKPVLCADDKDGPVLMHCPDKPDHLCVLMPVRMSTTTEPQRK